MQYYLIRDGKKTGPMASYDVMSGIREGTITTESLMWHKGLERWQPAGTLPKLESWFASVSPATVEAEPDFDQEEAAAEIRTAPVAADEDGAGTGAGEAAATALPLFVLPAHDEWRPRIGRRMLARFFDVVFYTTFLVGALILYYGDASQALALLTTAQGNIGSYLLFALVETWFIHRSGLTPGKWLLGMRIESADGRHPGLTESLSRSFLVAVRGMALGVGLFLPLTLTLLVLEWKKTGLAYWDRVNGLKVRHGAIPDWRTAVVVGLIVLMFAIWGVLFGEAAQKMLETGLGGEAR